MGAICGVVGSTALISTVFGADSVHGATTAQSTMYAGPGESYPQVMRLAGGLQISIHGCTDQAKWCDVTWRGKRGWVQAEGLELRSHGESAPVSAAVVPVTNFEFSSYWDANYKTRLWYADRAKWQNLPAPVQSADAGSSGSNR